MPRNTTKYPTRFQVPRRGLHRPRITTRSFEMTDENKALIGKQCFVKFEGKRHSAEIVDVVQTVKATNEIILYCLRLSNGERIGARQSEVELI